MPYRRRRSRTRARWTTSSPGSGQAAARSSRGSAPSAPSRPSASRTRSFCGSSPRSRSATASRPCLRLSTPTSRRLRRLLQHAVLVELDEHRAAGRLNPTDGLPPRLGANARWYADPAARCVCLVGVARSRAPGARGRCRGRRSAAARSGRPAPARNGAANCGRLRDLHRRRYRSGGVLIPHRPAGDRLFLLRVDSPYSAGEANVRKRGGHAER